MVCFFLLPLIHACDCKSGFFFFFLNHSKTPLNDDFITISLIPKAGSFAGGYRYIKSQLVLKYSSRHPKEHFLPFISCRGSIYL